MEAPHAVSCNFVSVLAIRTFIPTAFPAFTRLQAPHQADRPEQSPRRGMNNPEALGTPAAIRGINHGSRPKIGISRTAQTTTPWTRRTEVTIAVFTKQGATRVGAKNA
jgi:hypothetical protein